MQEEKTKELKVLYLHGRPSAHPIHSAFARAITPNFGFVDETIQWQDKERGIIFNVFAWIVNALFLKDKRKFDIFLVDNLHAMPVIMRMLGLIKKRQKIIVHLGSHTLYFMYSGKFSPLNVKLHKFLLKKYDALLCEGQMAEDLSKLLLGKKCPPTYVNFLGSQLKVREKLSECIPNFEENNILIIANGPVKFREFYKGLDIMVQSFKLAFQSNNKIRLYILGDWSAEIIKELLLNTPEQTIKAIHFEGSKNTIESYVSYFSNSALCLHTARGDAFPTSTVDSMRAGVPTMVSDWTGTKEIAAQIDPRLIVPLDVNDIAAGILWYFQLTVEEKKKLSIKSRQVSDKFTEENAIDHYKNTFRKIEKDLNIIT